MIPVLAVAGARGGQRGREARRLAVEQDFRLLTAAEVRSYGDLSQALSSVEQEDPWATGLVLEVPEELHLQVVIAVVAEPGNSLELRAVVAVVDGVTMLDELADEGYEPLMRDGRILDVVPRAHIAASRIEFASHHVLHPGLDCEPGIRALLKSLGPAALPFWPGKVPRDAMGREQVSPGWVQVLNGEASVSAESFVRYQNVRPFHPERLRVMLESGFADGGLGEVVRSAGFCRVASRPGRTALWDHVGHVISFEPVASDEDQDEDSEPLALGQDLVFFGFALSEAKLKAALDQAVLTDDEFMAGPEIWKAMKDQLPPWGVHH